MSDCVDCGRPIRGPWGCQVTGKRCVRTQDPRGGKTESPFAEKFWSKVAVLGPDDCWEWQGATTGEGYGRFYDDGKCLRATHVALMLWRAESVPDGMQALHSCDNPPCVNPGHLRAGTSAENAADCVARGRQSRGGWKGSMRLTTSEVREIRARYVAGGITQKALGVEYGIGHKQVNRIVTRKAWPDA